MKFKVLIVLKETNKQIKIINKGLKDLYFKKYNI